MLEKKSILVVDDDKATLRSVAEILRSEGYDVCNVETGREALEKAETNFYNLALLDIVLPDTEGVELLKKMHEKWPAMMKIMITGFPSMENAIASLNTGADAYLIKPVEPQQMLSIVEGKLKEQEEVARFSQEKSLSRSFILYLPQKPNERSVQSTST